MVGRSWVTRCQLSPMQGDVNLEANRSWTFGQMRSWDGNVNSRECMLSGFTIQFGEVKDHVITNSIEFRGGGKEGGKWEQCLPIYQALSPSISPHVIKSNHGQLLRKHCASQYFPPNNCIFVSYPPVQWKKSRQDRWPPGKSKNKNWLKEAA